MESHEELLEDLLTPLAVMKGAISIVLKHGDRLTPQERAKWLELAIAQSDQLNALMVSLDPARSGNEITLPDADNVDASGEMASAPPAPPTR
jgi:K+-sensing histidine kinase KdpD